MQRKMKFWVNFICGNMEATRRYSSATQLARHGSEQRSYARTGVEQPNIRIGML